MKYRITAPERIKETIALPASKSISNRALIIHALTGGDILPENLSDCDDTTVMVRALRDMPDTIDIKAAGTAMRFMTAYLAVTPGTHIITGTERMQQRPIGILVDALRYLGADIRYTGNAGYPPLLITGKHLDGGYVEVPGDTSSQFISALLLIGPALSKGLELRLTGDIISKPYIELTLCTMRDYGAAVDWTSHDTITVEPRPYQPRPYSIENDWSSASYWYEIAMLAPDDDTEIQMTGLTDGSKQGDSMGRYLFNLLGIKTYFADKRKGVPTTIRLKRFSHPLNRIDYDFKTQPDLAQTFVVTCAMLDIPFHFTGLCTLKIKETDRIEALKREMRKLGYVVRDINGQELVWDGERCEADAEPVIETYNDHRMALSFAPAAFRFPGLRIDHPEVVTKSYPEYWNHLRQAGFILTEEP